MSVLDDVGAFSLNLGQVRGRVRKQRIAIWLGRRELVRLGSVAPPAQSLQILRGRHASLGDRDDVVDLEEEVRLCGERHRAGPAGVVVAGFDEVAQLRGHQGALAGAVRTSSVPHQHRAAHRRSFRSR